MARKIKGNVRLDAALLEMAQDFRGRLISHRPLTRSPSAFWAAGCCPSPSR